MTMHVDTGTISSPGDRPAGRPMPEMERPMPETPGRRMGYAVVGLGQFALNQIIPSFARSRSSKLVALVSGHRDKALQVAERYGIAQTNIYDYQTFDRIADNGEIDIVYIILPNALHAEFAVRAFKAGKHVLCEKPMAVTVEECETMIRAGREADRKLMIAYRAQYEPSNMEAIRMAREGDLGKIRLVTSDHGRILDPKVPADQWRMVRALAGGGSLYDIGIYSLQAARYITGEEPVEVSGRISSDRSDPRFKEIEDLVAFQLRFPSGALANLTSSYSTSPVKRIQVFGSKASLILDPATEYERHEMVVKTAKEERRVQIPEDNQFAAEMDHLSKAVMEGREPKTPGEEGLRDIRILQAVYQAAREGKPVILKTTNVPLR
ncbi:Gfo/Idh/MocA family protein [Microvirga lotononidis]|uniref:Putative dehydrogenase n=1 Tax=Microvirga lotononidis TaxID=864069 RepID=I4YVJ5_9HYPH|nr:Gfo/Idh/MocA family oxidoreductase [Microvirga lotononidis]EIM27987.1 putative dehydrogenase [Microvirga lotononidis]WQO27895.1 Gfo/Idh/MocA family oxidoreductase [Microvirga lotononidis]